MKYVAREIPPEHVDFSWYFDNDGFRSVSGALNAIYIIPPSRRAGYNLREFNELKAQAQQVIDDYENGYEIDEALVEWAKYADPDDLADMTDYLTITTGAPWHTKSFYGYSQGDYCEVIYCSDVYTDDSITDVGNFWLGCGTEFEIDGCRGYFIRDTIRWDEGNELIEQLAAMAGCKPEQLDVYLYTGTRAVHEYKTISWSQAQNDAGVSR